MIVSSKRAHGRRAAVLVISSGLAALIGWGVTEPLAAAGRGTATFDELMALGAAAVAGGTGVWLALAMAVSALATLPGWCGRVTARCADRIAPQALRHVVHAVVGVTAVAASATLPAYAQPDVAGHVVVASTAADTDLPGVGRPGVAQPPLPQPREPREPRIPPEADPPEPPEEVVVVQPGDTLWAIAGRHLGPNATDTEIAREWPRWFEANRAQIGDDPDVIQPGVRLSPPESR